MKKSLFFLLFLLITSCQSQRPPDFNALKNKLDKEYSAKTAGIALAVANDTSTLWAGSFGMANIALKKPMTLDHTLNIASVSKVFVATAIMQLSENGLLTLDDPINLHLPFEINLPNNPKSPITIQHLLTHRSSIIDGKYYGESYTTDALYTPLSRWLENYLHKKGKNYSINNFSDDEPGQNWRYSNIGFGLLALIVEKVAGLSFELYCQKYIFTPLQMNHTAWKYPKEKQLSATSYAYFTHQPNADELSQISKLLGNKTMPLNTYLPILPYRFPNYPDGLLFSSVQDLRLFAQCMLNHGKLKDHQILSKESVHQMFEIQGEEEDKQGLCWRYTGFGSVWGHGGDDPGVQTGLYVDRENNRAMIMIKNSNLGSRAAMIKDLYQASMQLNE